MKGYLTVEEDSRKIGFRRDEKELMSCAKEQLILFGYQRRGFSRRDYGDAFYAIEIFNTPYTRSDPHL